MTAASVDDPLMDLPLLPADRRFIRRQLARSAGDPGAVLLEYRRCFLAAMAAERDEIRRENSGRLAANAWLLNRSNGDEKDEPDYF